jgi:4-amino-4-deoxy-L-arabinose transferase-like glycosyltransferase
MNKLFSKLWTPAAAWPLLALAAVLAAQTLYALDVRALWYSDEVRYANVLEHVIHAKKWLVMYLNGQPYSDKPPVYFWFLSAFKPFFPGLGPPLFMLGSAVSALLMLAATSLFTRRVLGADRHTALAAGLTLLTCFYFIGVSHYTRMDLLFAAIITLSHVFFFAAWNRDRAPLLTAAAFGLAGLAVLTKGPLGFAFPAVTGVIYLAWTGRITRLFRRDILFGLILFAALVGGWLAAAWFAGEHEFVERIFYKEVYKRALDAPHHRQGPWYYFATLPLAWLPWTLVILALPLTRLFRGAFWSGIWRSRGETGRGSAYVWIMLVSGFVLLTLVSIKIIIYLLPLYPALAALTARRVLDLDEAGTKRLFYAVGGLMLVVAAVLPFGNLLHQWPIEIEGLVLSAAVSALSGLAIILRGRREGPRGALIVTAVAVTIWLAPLNLIVAPSLDPVMSPKAQGEVMGEYARQGYAPMAYKIYSGTYTYYADATIMESQDREFIETQIRKEPKVVIGMQKRYWDEWKDRPDSLEIVHEQWIVERPYVLAVKGPDTTPEPVDLPEEPAPGESAPDAEGAVEEAAVEKPDAPPDAPSGDGAPEEKPLNEILKLEHETLEDVFLIRIYTRSDTTYAVETGSEPDEIAVHLFGAAKPPVPSGARDLDPGAGAGPAVTRLEHDTVGETFTVRVLVTGEVDYEIRPMEAGPGLVVAIKGVTMPGLPEGELDMAAYR